MTPILVGVLCALLHLFISCSTISSTTEENVEPTDKRILIENRILENIVTNPLSAAQLIAYYRQRQDLFFEYELDVFRPSLEQKLSVEFMEHLEAKRFSDAAAFLRTMRALKYDIPDNILLEDIAYLEIRSHLERNNYLPLLFSMHRVKDYLSFTEQEIFAIVDIAFRHNHRILLASILEQINTRYPVRVAEYRQKMEAVLTLTDMLRGTVTIWVDKGFAITDGVSRLDRVYGSAFFVDARGYLLTNYHVIASEVDPEYEGYSRLYVRLSDNIELRVPAKVVGYDRLLDIALLKTEIEPEYIFALEPYEEQYIAGTRTYALGSPLGLDKSITSGIISSSSRQFLPIGQTLQIDAPVNPGNSGGPLVDADGRLAGVIYAGTPQFQGINFAIPTSWIWQNIPNLFSAMHNNHFWLGVATRAVNNMLEVIYVIPDGPADALDIKVGDSITHISGNLVRKISDAQFELAQFQSGGLLRVDWLINNHPQTYFVKIEKRPFSPMEQVLEVQKIDQLFVPLFGMEAQRIGSRLNSNKFVVRKVYNATIADELGFAVSDPFSLLRWRKDDDARVIIMEMRIQKIKNGFSTSTIQIANTLDLPNFI